MTVKHDGSIDPLSPDEVDALMAQIEKGQQLAGHFPDASALDRARRILVGELTLDEAHDEIEAEIEAELREEAQA